jgi:hypothetical protein
MSLNAVGGLWVLEIDEVIDLWRLILPRHRNLWYDEEEERIHYNEEAEAVPSE